jgi:phosphoglycerol transferase
MRIAYHNPWVNSAENQIYMSMAEAGRRIGVELIACADENDIDACRPDFVLAVASSVAKITDHPTYLTVHEPKTLFLDQPQRMRNLFTFDGYLTISDSLVRFIQDFTAGAGRCEDAPGFCYITPQRSDLHCDWDRNDLPATLRVVYFGTNWNRRGPLLFRALDPMGILRIQGPEASWDYENYASYHGPAAFDGEGPQRAYADCGIGLVLMDERWHREDVVSNRIFEISSVGAVSICPDMPWIRKWFGDSVFYFDPTRPMREVADQIRLHHAFCASNPGVARRMGQAARDVFETHFTAERMLANAVEYHSRKTAERARLLAAMPPAPHVAVVMRCGGRGLDMVRRAVDSIRNQTYGRFTIIFVAYRAIDLSPITADRSGAIAGFVEIPIEGGNRSQTLWGGLAHIDAPFFAVLDDDDFNLSDHFETLFRAGWQVDPDFDMAFCGQIEFDAPSAYNYGTQLAYRNVGRFGFKTRVVDAWHIGTAVGTNGFVARSDLLSPAILGAPNLNTCEDTLLVTLAARRSKPVFSWRATAFYRAHSTDGSNWQHDPQRGDDEMSFALRAGLLWSPRWLADASFELPALAHGVARHKPGSAVLGEQMGRLTAGSAGEAGPRGIRARPGGVGFVSEGPQAKLNPGRYVAIVLITPSAPEDALPPYTGEDPVGAAEIVVMAAGGGYLGHRKFFAADAELEMRFTVDATIAQSPIEIRVYAYGNTAFTVASIGLHRDLADPLPADPPPPPPAPPAPDTPDGPAPELAALTQEVAALRAQIAALRASTSWRLTAPLRRLVTLARRDQR